LWVGDTISQFGTTISRLALPLLAVLVLHASPFQVGLPSQSVAMVAGLSVGGALVQVLGAPTALLGDALSYLWSATWIGTISVRPARPQRLPERSLRRDIAEGLRFVLGNRALRAITLTTGVSNLFSSASSVLVIVLLASTLGLPPGLIGLATSAAAIGGLIGAAVAAPIARRIGPGPAICASVAVIGVAGLVAPFVYRDWTFGLLLGAEFVLGAGVVIYNITQVSFRQRLCPPALLGRMNATIRLR
jgi:Na+/melibiose symporter-like transporter